MYKTPVFVLFRGSKVYTSYDSERSSDSLRITQSARTILGMLQTHSKDFVVAISPIPRNEAQLSCCEELLIAETCKYAHQRFLGQTSRHTISPPYCKLSRALLTTYTKFRKLS